MTDSVGGDQITSTLGDEATNAVIGKENTQTVQSPAATNTLTFNGLDAAQIYRAIQDLSYVVLDVKQQFTLGLSEVKQTMQLNSALTNDKLDNQNKRLSIAEEVLQNLKREVADIRLADQSQETQIKSVITQVSELSTKISTSTAQTAAQHQATQSVQQNNSPLLVIVFVVGTTVGALVIALIGFYLQKGG